MVPFAGEEKVVSELFPAVLAVLCLGKAAGVAAAAAAAARRSCVSLFFLTHLLPSSYRRRK